MNSSKFVLKETGLIIGGHIELEIGWQRDGSWLPPGPIVVKANELANAIEKYTIPWRGEELPEEVPDEQNQD